jgi:hypothetical protein
MTKENDKKERIQQILSSSLDVDSKLKKTDSDIQEYVRVLENQCTKLYSQYFKMKAENVSLKRKVLDLEKKPRGNIVIRPRKHTEK